MTGKRKTLVLDRYLPVRDKYLLFMRATSHILLGYADSPGTLIAEKHVPVCSTTDNWIGSPTIHQGEGEERLVIALMSELVCGNVEESQQLVWTHSTRSVRAREEDLQHIASIIRLRLDLEQPLNDATVNRPNGFWAPLVRFLRRNLTAAVAAMMYASRQVCK